MRITAAALAAAVALSGLVATPARAAVTQPSGPVCDSVGTTSDAGATWAVTFVAGPLTIVDEDDPARVRTGTVTCSLRYENDHTSPVFAAVTGEPGAGAAVLAGTTTVPGPYPYHLYRCTRLDLDGATLYWAHAQDRNGDGRWSSDPSSACDTGGTTTDIRPQDPPQGWVFSAASTAYGEVDFAAEAAACTVPAVADALRDVWVCGPPSSLGSVSFVRVPGAALVRTVPFGWSCTDMRTGLAVTRGSLVSTPDPGVSCVPLTSSGVDCSWLEVSGFLAPATLGRVTVTNACGYGGVSRVLTAAQGRLVEQWSGGWSWVPPLRCSADEDTHPAEPAYAVVCNFYD